MHGKFPAILQNQRNFILFHETIPLNDGKWCIGVFLDFKKAFDTVQHDILLRKLSMFGVRGTSLDWFTSYLSNRIQCVDINGSLSDF
jgi:hypothetical protein